MAQAEAMASLPFGTRSLRLGWRLTSSGTARVKELVLVWLGEDVRGYPGRCAKL